jgi:hypothetical protein
MVNAAEPLARSLSEPLTWAEICEQYPDEWVCVVEIEREGPNDVAIRSARIVGHGKTKKESLDQVNVWWATYPVIGHFFTGTIKPPLPRFPRVVMTDEIRELVRNRR